MLGLADVAHGQTQSILDVGCGNGAYERALAARGHQGTLVALDLSAGMLHLVTKAARVQADVQILPFPRDSFDLVLAPHMLYHVPDIETAAHEVRRVLRSGGVFIAVTNSVSNLQELSALVEAAVGTGWHMVRPADEHFNLDNGAAMFASSFASVVRIDCPQTHLVVTDLDAAAEYVASVADHYEDQVGISWDEVVGRVRELARASIEAYGELRFSTGAGAFVCK